MNTLKRPLAHQQKKNASIMEMCLECTYVIYNYYICVCISHTYYIHIILFKIGNIHLKKLQNFFTKLIVKVPITWSCHVKNKNQSISLSCIAVKKQIKTKYWNDYFGVWLVGSVKTNRKFCWPCQSFIQLKNNVLYNCSMMVLRRVMFSDKEYSYGCPARVSRILTK